MEVREDLCDCGQWRTCPTKSSENIPHKWLGVSILWDREHADISQTRQINMHGDLVSIDSCSIPYVDELVEVSGLDWH
jgi:RNA polymerase subunit RPABC4/transcription elongation factor Spt4